MTITRRHQIGLFYTRQLLEPHPKRKPSQKKKSSIRQNRSNLYLTERGAQKWSHQSSYTPLVRQHSVPSLSTNTFQPRSRPVPRWCWSPFPTYVQANPNVFSLETPFPSNLLFQPYDEVSDLDELQERMVQSLSDYNARSRKPMDLVMFMFAVEHVSRLAR